MTVGDYIFVKDGFHDGLRRVVNDGDETYYIVDMGSNHTGIVAKDKCSEPVLWLTGRRNTPSWEILGIYSSKEKAVARCRMRQDFIAPLVLNEDAPEEPVELEHVEWPLILG